MEGLRDFYFELRDSSEIWHGLKTKHILSLHLGVEAQILVGHHATRHGCLDIRTQLYSHRSAQNQIESSILLLMTPDSLAGTINAPDSPTKPQVAS